MSPTPSSVGAEIRALAPVILVGLLYVARVAHSGEDTYGFLLWNVFLAGIPLFLARFAVHLKNAGQPRAMLLMLAGWLLFLPNAPYVLTDFVHLRERAGAPLWYDVALLGSAAFAGLVLGVASLARVRDLVAESSGERMAGAAVVLASLLSGYGIYLGRFTRLNSWDVAFHPFAVLARAVPPLLDPLHHPRAWGVTLIFGMLLAMAYLAYSGSGARLKSTA